MARSRILKPGWLTNEVLADLGPYAQILFAGLWLYADREGRLEDRPRRLKAQILPFYNVDVDDLLQKLHDAGFILRYSYDQSSSNAGTSTVNDGSATDTVSDTAPEPENIQKYIQVLNWHRHQSVHRHEPESEIPSPFQEDVEPGKNGTSTVLTRGVCTTLPHQRIRIRNRNRGSGEGGPGGEGNATPPADTFIAIPLIDGSDFYVTRFMVDEWKALYQAVDVEQALRNIRGWNLAEKRRRKTRGGVVKHITTWLAKEQDRGGSGQRSKSPTAAGQRMGRIDRARAAIAAHEAAAPQDDSGGEE